MPAGGDRGARDLVARGDRPQGRARRGAQRQLEHLIEVAIDDFVLARFCFVLYLMAERIALESKL